MPLISDSRFRFRMTSWTRPATRRPCVASSTALMGFPGQSTYSATKGAVRGLSESLSAELYRSPVKVTSIYPGGIRTGLFEAARGADRAEMARMGEEPRLARMFLWRPMSRPVRQPAH